MTDTATAFDLTPPTEGEMAKLEADLTEEDLSVAGTIFQIGVAPNRIDVITSVDALEFEACAARCTRSTYAGVPIRLLSKEDLLINKRAVGRAQDMLDVENLEKAK